jgi:hypothetical protein
MAVKSLNSKAEVMGRTAALFMNINAAKGLHDVMRTNLGPKGTIKMLVGGSGGAPMRSACLQTCCTSAAARMKCFKHGMGACRHQAHQGRQRAAARNADPEPHSRNDRAHGGSPGRHHRVRSRRALAAALPRIPQATRRQPMQALRPR